MISTVLWLLNKVLPILEDCCKCNFVQKAKKIGRKNWLLFSSWKSLKKRAGFGSGSIIQCSGTDLQIRNYIKSQKSRIPNTAEKSAPKPSTLSIFIVLRKQLTKCKVRVYLSWIWYSRARRILSYFWYSFSSSFSSSRVLSRSSMVFKNSSI